MRRLPGGPDRPELTARVPSPCVDVAGLENCGSQHAKGMTKAAELAHAWLKRHKRQKLPLFFVPRLRSIFSPLLPSQWVVRGLHFPKCNEHHSTQALQECCEVKLGWEVDGGGGNVG